MSETGLVSGDIYSVSDLAPGTYMFQFFDDSNAQIPKTIVIAQGTGLTIDSMLTRPDCFDSQGGGRIELEVADGSPFSGGYIFSWSNSLIEIGTSSQITNVSGGNYSVTITDSLGCSTPLDFDLSTAPLDINANLSQPLCDDDLGTIELLASGGTGSYVARLYRGLDSDGLSDPSGPIVSFGQNAPTLNRLPGTYYINLQNRNPQGAIIQNCSM